MPKQPMTVSWDKPPNERAFNEYVQSDSWQCHKGGAHFWVHVEGDTWRCGKCKTTKKFNCAEYDWDSSLAGDVIFGVAGLFDALQKRRGY